MRKHYLLLTAISILQFSHSNAQVAPLLTTTWNQTCNYNEDLPTVGSGGACGRAYTGCNATAIGQIMKYYNYPTTGMGNHCNTTNPSYCVDFSTQTYNYSLMPNSLSSANVEVAKLMLHVGIAVNMTWSGTNSTSFFNTTALKQFFLYSPKMYSTAIFMFNTTQELIDALKQELDEGRVVFCKTNTLNHFYLIDGYNSSDLFHCNFGWGGTYDGYYDITNVSIMPGNATPQNFIFNIRPLQGSLETAVDTINVSANAGLQGIEFTSLNSWAMTTNTSWISLNQNSGISGYNSPTASANFNCSINNGEERIGYIYIDNGIDIDTLVVKQAASPLVVNPDSLQFTHTGGSEIISIDWFSWSTWNATTSNTWFALSQNTGTGSGTITVTASSNSLTTEREGYVILTGGSFSDTIYVNQEATLTTGIYEDSNSNGVNIHPNPANDILYIKGISSAQKTQIKIIDVFGRTVFNETTNKDFINVEILSSGTYLIVVTSSDNKLLTKTKFIKQ